jgi:hypothetical protein
MFSALRLWLYGALAAAVAVLTLGAYRKGGKDKEAAYIRRRVDAMRDAKETRHEVQNSDDARIVDILTGKLRK